MIFVLLGTQDAPFHRIIQLVREMVESTDWSEEVVIQSGVTPVQWENRYVMVQPFFDKEAFQEHFKNARLIITHGGAGTIFEAMNEKKKTLVIPRQAMYAEHVDDHQLELTEMLSRLEYVEMYQSGLLLDALKQLEVREYRTYEANHELVNYMKRSLI
ncbi:MAG: glycosyltransferase [Culicoidibacterales bacterium]